MPKAVLSFNLPEERDDFELAQKGLGYKLALGDLDEFLRGKLKYEEISTTEAVIYQKVRDQLHEYLADNDVKLH